jgi:hypothetical protein
MIKYRDTAFAILDTFSDSDMKSSMKEFITFTTSRAK